MKSRRKEKSSSLGKGASGRPKLPDQRVMALR
jgi:hypothetical protein